MLRIIVRTSDSGEACNVGGPVHVTHQTLDVEIPELEKLLEIPPKHSYIVKAVVGVEVRTNPPDSRAGERE